MDSRQAWEEFWSAGGEGTATCLPKAVGAIDAIQDKFWTSFAAGLPRRAHVLDLGTGSGAVLRRLKGARPDLALTGVDSSPCLPPAPKGITLRAGVPMEALPFPRSRFGAIVSQFGFEYGDTAAIAQEAARVVRPDAPILLMVHRRDGVIVEHNLRRREALSWILDQSEYLGKASALVRARRTVALPTPALFQAAPAEMSQRFPGQSVGAEFMLAVCQTLQLGFGGEVETALGTLEALERKARGEIKRIETLHDAARDDADVEQLIEELETAGFAMSPPGKINEGSGRPLAWRIAGRRVSDRETSP
jgi:SAM-dependent methyltransferase